MNLTRFSIIVLLLSISSVVSGQVEIDTAIHVKSIYFGGGSYYIDPWQEQSLKEWLDSFPQLEQYEILIHSHTDNIGSVAFNKRLSEMRSLSVYEKLMSYPVVEEAVEIIDFGKFLPKYRNDTHHGRLANRRTDVILKPVSL